MDLSQPEEDRPIFSAAERLAHLRRQGKPAMLPVLDSAILCYQLRSIERSVRRRRLQMMNGLFGDCYRISGTCTAIAGNFGAGAPVSVVLLEDLAALGAREFIAIGLAGGLQDGLQAGDIVICDQAIRDEGTSRHYLPPGKFATASPGLTRRMALALERGGQPYAIGTSWTTDAPYREMRRKVEQHQREGVKTVEMESAALFAAGQALELSVSAAFCIGDSLAGLQWQLDFDQQKARRGLKTLFNFALQVLESA